ncbi:MAG: DUF3098 domain-containing protein [Bacteroidota bacterium]
MSDQKQNVNSPLFTKDNYTWMLIGGAVIALGMLLMSGGKSADPKVFDTKEVYSTVRITIAPALIVLGLLVEIYAIFKKPKAVPATV